MPIKRSNRIKCDGEKFDRDYTSGKGKNDVKKRLKNIGKWCASICGLPLTYVILPVSCCIRNPVAAVVFEDDEDGTPKSVSCLETDKKKRANKINYFIENLAVGMFSGVSTMFCCGCCFGCFGEYGPKEF